jgi:myo-inositol-1(or 4)-monophosphatase
MRDILEIALDAALAGAETARRHFADLASLDFTMKDTGKHPGADVVSLADADVERVIKTLILSRRPDDSILGEEGGLVAGLSDFTWIIDPIDGTLNFSYHRTPFAVSIGVRDGNGMVVGVVVQVQPQRVFMAMRGEGATCDGEPIGVSTVQSLAQALIDVGRGRGEVRHRFADVVGVLDRRTRDIRRGGCAAVAACEVAAGELDAMYGPGLEVWDICAGALIAEEAGAIRYDIGSDVIVLAAPGVVDELALVLAEVLE